LLVFSVTHTNYPFELTHLTLSTLISSAILTGLRNVYLASFKPVCQHLRPCSLTAHVRIGPTLTVLVPDLNPAGVWMVHSLDTFSQKHKSAPEGSIMHLCLPDIDIWTALLMPGGNKDLSFLDIVLVFSDVFEESFLEFVLESFVVSFLVSLLLSCFFLVSFGSVLIFLLSSVSFLPLPLPLTVSVGFLSVLSFCFLSSFILSFLSFLFFVLLSFDLPYWSTSLITVYDLLLMTSSSLALSIFLELEPFLSPFSWFGFLFWFLLRATFDSSTSVVSSGYSISSFS